MGSGPPVVPPLDPPMPVKKCSAMSGRFQGWTSTKQSITCLAQGNNMVPPERLKLTAPLSQVKHSSKLSSFYGSKIAWPKCQRLWAAKSSCLSVCPLICPSVCLSALVLCSFTYMLVKPADMCLVAQVVGALVQCFEGCKQHNLAVCLPAYLSVHLPMAVCLAVSVLCSFDFL